MDQDQGQTKGDDRNPVLQPGESLGNFRVTKCLCAGLIANYYQAQHARDLHEVTIAVLHQRVKASADFMKRMNLLQKKVQLMDHEGIPQINEYDEIGGKVCLFMDPVDGQSLTAYFADRAAEGKGLEADETARILVQLLGLVGYMHSKGVDHRDIDSGLIFIREDGSLSLLGIGLKAALGVQSFEQVVSASVCPIAGEQSAEHLSSFDVMSPEYKSGIEEDNRVDLYCLGVLGYWLLTGQKPNHARYKAPSEFVGGLPAHWDPFFEKMLERDRDQRLQSCRSASLRLQDTDTNPVVVKGGLIQRQIDRIPVPKGVRARGKRATRIYQLTTIGLVGVPLFALAAQFMLSALVEEDVSRSDVAQRVAGDQIPQLELRVTPASAKVDFVGFDKSFILQSGRLELSVVPGEYELQVSAPEHVGQRKKVVISEDAEFTKRMTFQLEEQRLRLSLRSEPFARFYLVDSETGAIELGQAGEDGLFEFDRQSPKGDFRIVARKPGYQEAALSSNFIEERASAKKGQAGDAPVFDLSLVTLPATLKITSEPSGARIGLKGEYIGVTPLTLVELEPSDKVVVTAEKEGFRPQQRQIRMKPGVERSIDFGALVPRSGEIKVELAFEGSDLDSARQLREDTVIRVGEASYPVDSEAIQAIPEGRHTVRAEHPLYFSDSKEVTLRDGEEKSIRFQLQARPATVRLSYPDGLSPKVSAGGRQLEIQDGKIRVPANKTLKLEARIRDHLTLVRQLRLKPAESVNWDINPVRIKPPQIGQDWTVPYVGIRIVWVPAGEFQMGSPPPEQGRLPNEGPRTSVTLSQGFWSGVFEATQAQYEYIMGENPSTYVGSKRPVESLSWNQAETFCQRLTAVERQAGRLPEGYVYRLPTEAEWAYAGRAGTETPFHFGDRADALKGNFLGVYPREFEDGVRQGESYGTKPVGKYGRNAFGLYDVHGNVREWTKDAYAARLPGGRLTDPSPRDGRDSYTVRGGGWASAAVRARSAAREDVGKETQSDSLGFRVFLAPVR